MSATNRDQGDHQNQEKSAESQSSAEEKRQEPDGELTEKHPDQRTAEQEEQETWKQEEAEQAERDPDARGDSTEEHTDQKAAKKEEQATKEQEEASADTGEKKFDFSSSAPATDFLIVGIGASAGGVDALKKLFRNIKKDSGMAYVIIIHLSPDRESIMPEILGKETSLPVCQVEDGMEIEPDHIYMNPSDQDVSLEKGVFRLDDIHGRHSERLPIDIFLRSLAKVQNRNSVCLILSGSGTDGTQGLKAVKEAGGLVIVQDPDEAEYDGMPRSAIDSGFVDYVQSLEKIPDQLTDFFAGSTQITIEDDTEESSVKKQLQKIFSFLQQRTGHDFSNYKLTTVNRRIERRMSVHRLSDLSSYVKLLQRSKNEADKLFRELLISVTNFFRDPKAFEALKEQVLKPLVKSKSHNETLRVWVPGCATGEEAYSIAIQLQELMHKYEKNLETQIFATDLDHHAIVKARKGIYPDSISVDLDKSRLNKFFTREGDYFSVKSAIRQMLVIAEQNVIKDPPFKNLDLLSCRNLLIYLDSSIQKNLVPMLHYSLKTNGYLFLGNSESIGGFAHLFSTVSQKHKIFKVKAASPQQLDILNVPLTGNRSGSRDKDRFSAMDFSIADMAESSILEHFAPPSVIVDKEGIIRYIHGRTGKFLEPAAGEARMNIYDMAREGLASELYGAVNRLIQNETDHVILEQIRVQTNGDTVNISVDLRQICYGSLEQNFILIAFSEQEDPPGVDAGKEQAEISSSDSGDQRIQELKRELRNTRENLQTKVEEYQTTNEELKSSNEELQSASEELQSTNEELETAEEELQSLNEELETVNDELNEKNRELKRTHADLDNLMNSIEIPVLFLDTETRVKRFTNPVSDVINIIEKDQGRNINDFSSNLKKVDIGEHARKVLKNLRPIEKDVQTKNGRWYKMHVMPYQREDNKIDGVVISFSDIHDKKVANKKLKDINERLRHERRFAEEIIKTVRNPLIVLDENLQIQSANPAYYQMFDTSESRLLGKNIMQVDEERWDVQTLKELLNNILPEHSSIEDFELTTTTPDGQKRTLLLNAAEITTHEEKDKRILLAMEDMTHRKTGK